jgi:hypothetical protein
MSIISEIREFKISDFLLCVAVFLATVAPGFLILYLYKPTFVKELDIFKLLLFSGSLTLPGFLLNVLFMAAATTNIKNWSLKEDISTSSILSFFAYYIIITIAYFLGLTFRFFIFAMIGLEAILGICSFLVAYIQENRKKT